MSNLGPQNINLSFNGLLQAPGGLTSAPQPVTDGNGNVSDLQIALSGSSIPNLSNGVAGQIPYQTGDGLTGFAPIGSPGQVLTSNGTGTPYWSSGGSATTATSIAGGGAGQIVYQASTANSAFVPVGSTGSLMTANGTLAPSWVNPASVLVGLASNINGGLTGSIPYQSAPNTTTFLNPGNTGQLLRSNGVGANPSWESNITMSSTGQVNFTGLATAPAGTAGDIYYNSTSNQFQYYNGTTWTLVGGATVTDDTSTTSTRYPLFSNATSGTVTSVYTSSSEYNYLPSTGELSASAHISTNGFTVNSKTVSKSYTIASGNSAVSAGPITINSGVTVTISSGSHWVVV
jgi:hypothetical protein